MGEQRVGNAHDPKSPGKPPRESLRERDSDDQAVIQLFPGVVYLRQYGRDWCPGAAGIDQIAELYLQSRLLAPGSGPPCAQYGPLNPRAGGHDDPPSDYYGRRDHSLYVIAGQAIMAAHSGQQSDRKNAVGREVILEQCAQAAKIVCPY